MTTRNVPPDCRAQVIGRTLWRERGALALRRTGSGFVIDAARPPNFDRPWSPQRMRITDVANSSAIAAPPGALQPRDATPRPEDIEADE
jgi:competence protein ComEC